MKVCVSIRNGRAIILPAIVGLWITLGPAEGVRFLSSTSGSQASAADPPAQTPGGADPATQNQELPQDREAAANRKEAADAPRAIPEASGETREERFANYMTGATLAGRFTVVGKANDEMPEEEYTITKCEKLPEGDLFRFTARIRYGETDLELPMDLPVRWAGDTPMITLTNLWIPGLGTFSSRVLIYRGQYAGTWSHGEVGGHMFGVIKKEAEPKESQRK